MLSHLRESLALASAGLPRRWLYFPYFLLIHTIQSKLESNRSKVWVRNSLANNYWEFAQSDLDLTIWVDSDMQEASEYFYKLKPLRRILLGGEVHIFPAQLIPKYIDYANPLELGRDPILKKKINFNRAPTESEKIVFLVKSLINDKKLSSLPILRRRRWLWVLRSILGPGHELPISFSRDYIIEKCLKPMAPWLSTFTTQEISAVIDGRHVPEYLLQLEKMLRPNQQIWFDKFNSKGDEFIQMMEDGFSDYLEAMIKWEIWGIFPLVQLTCGLSLEQLRQHVMNQKRLVSNINISANRKQSIVNGFDELLKDYDSIRDRFK